VALEREDAETTCEFCLMISAGVRIAQLTSSAVADAAEWIMGDGTAPPGL